MMTTCVILLLLPLIFPVLCQKCPQFQSIIPLRPSATTSNWSYAVIADAKYFLVGIQADNQRYVEASGDMPSGFENSRLTVIVDGVHCNESHYYLITIKSFRLSDERLQTNYSTLDLISWSQSSQWSEPKPITEHPMFSKDPFIKILTQFVAIDDFIHTLFYWHQMKTLFVVTKPITGTANHSTDSSALDYYSVTTQDMCRNQFSYPERMESLRNALNSVVQELDLCFFSHQRKGSNGLLYCIGNNSFQVNAVVNQLENGTLRTETIVSSDQKPTIETLRILESICPRVKHNESVEVIKVIEINAQIRAKLPYFGTTAPKSSQEPEESSKVWVVVIVLAVILLVMVGAVLAARRNQLLNK